jgi:hypothetical protein
MKRIPTLLVYFAMVCSVVADGPNYIGPLQLDLRGDFLQVKPTTYYRVSQVARIEAVVSVTTNFDKGEPLILTYPLDRQVLIIANTSRATPANGKSHARVEFKINGDSYLISTIDEKNFQDELYFERAISRSMEHFSKLLQKLQIKSEQDGRGDGDKPQN